MADEEILGACAEHQSLGIAALHRKAYAEAERQFQEALRLAQAAGSGTFERAAYFPLGRLAACRGQNTTARAIYERVLASAASAGDVEQQAMTHSELAAVLHDLEPGSREAHDHLIEAIRLKRQLGDDRSLANSLVNLAVMLKDEDRIDEASALFEEAIVLRESLGLSADASRTHRKSSPWPVVI